MKHSMFFALAAVACSSALAQAPAGTTERPPHQTNPTASGGMPAASADMKNDAKKGGMAGSTANSGSGRMGMMKGMDANGDGMVSKKEWDTHHSMMWRKMSKNGMMPVTDMERMMSGGPN